MALSAIVVYIYILYIIIILGNTAGKVATLTESECFLRLNPSLLLTIKIASKSLRKVPGEASEPLILL